MARSATTADVFNAIGDANRRDILDALIAGEKPVGAIVNDLGLSQPQVSKHLRVLSEVGLVRSRAEGRLRLKHLEVAHLQPFHDWLAKYEQAMNARLDRVHDYLRKLQHEAGGQQCHPRTMERRSSSSRANSRSSSGATSTRRSSSSSMSSRRRSTSGTRSPRSARW